MGINTTNDNSISRRKIEIFRTIFNLHLKNKVSRALLPSMEDNRLLSAYHSLSLSFVGLLCYGNRWRRIRSFRTIFGGSRTLCPLCIVLRCNSYNIINQSSTPTSMAIVAICDLLKLPIRLFNRESRVRKGTRVKVLKMGLFNTL